MTTPTPTPEPQKWTYSEGCLCLNGLRFAPAQGWRAQEVATVLAALNADGDADTRRLDWLRMNWATFDPLDTYIAFPNDKDALRAAIDAAMSQQPRKEGEPKCATQDSRADVATDTQILTAQSTPVRDSNRAPESPTPSGGAEPRLPKFIGDHVIHAEELVRRPAAPVGEWRMLEVGEMILEGDQFFNAHRSWIPTLAGGCAVTLGEVGKYRRRCEPAQATDAELVGKTPSDPSDDAEECDLCKQYAAELERLAAGNSSMEKEIPELRHKLAAARAECERRGAIIKELQEFGAALGDWFPDLSNPRRFPIERMRFIARQVRELTTERDAALAKLAEVERERAHFRSNEAHYQLKCNGLEDERDTALARIATLTARLKSLVKVILECEQDRLNAQSSGLETGWEHPGTQVHFKKVAAVAARLAGLEGGES